MNEKLDLEKCLRRISFIDPKEDYRFVDEIDDVRFYFSASIPSKQSLKTFYCKICIEGFSPSCVAFKSFRKSDDLIIKLKIWIGRNMRKIRSDHENLRKLGFHEREKFKDYRLVLGDYLLIVQRYGDMLCDVRMIRKEDDGKYFITPIKKKTKSGKTLTDTIFDFFKGCDLNLLPFMNPVLRDFISGGISKKNILELDF